MALVTSWYSQFIPSENASVNRALSVDTETGARIVSPVVPSEDVLNPLSLSSDAATLLIPGGNTVRMWDRVDNQWASYVKPGYSTSMVCHDWDRPLFTVDQGGLSEIYDFTDGQPLLLASASSDAFVGVRDFTCQDGVIATLIFDATSRSGLYATQVDTGQQVKAAGFADLFLDHRCLVVIDATRAAHAIGNVLYVREGNTVVAQVTAPTAFGENAAALTQDRSHLYAIAGDGTAFFIDLATYTHTQFSLPMSPTDGMTGFIGNDVAVYSGDNYAIEVPSGIVLPASSWFPGPADNGGVFPGNSRTLLPKDGAGARPSYLFWTAFKSAVETNVVTPPIPDPDPQPEPEPGEIGPFVLQLVPAQDELGNVGWSTEIPIDGQLSPTTLDVAGAELQLTDMYVDVDFADLLIGFTWETQAPMSNLRVFVDGVQLMDTYVSDNETMVGSTTTTAPFVVGQQSEVLFFLVPR